MNINHRAGSNGGGGGNSIASANANTGNLDQLQKQIQQQRRMIVEQQQISQRFAPYQQRQEDDMVYDDEDDDANLVNHEDFEGAGEDPSQDEDNASADEDDVKNNGASIDDDLNNKDEEDVQALLTELNDNAIQSLLKSEEANAQSNSNEHALECLKRGEQLLEAVTAEGKDVDRNLIVVILYNLACTYQRLSMLEDCASYLDGTIYNLEAKVTNFDDNQSVIQQMLQLQNTHSLSQDESAEGSGYANEYESRAVKQSTHQQQMQSVIETTKKFNISSKLFKLRYLCKCHLQLCAVLSQLNKHQEALYHGQMASFFCQELIKNTHSLCTSYINRLLAEKNSGKSNRTTSRQNAEPENILQELNEEDVNNQLKKTSYYVEENEKLLNVLITNCEPILSEISSLIDHFNSYNGIQKVIDKSQLFSQPSSYGGIGGSMGTIEDINITQDCRVLDNMAAVQQNQFKSARSNTSTNNYSKLKNNTYIVGPSKQGLGNSSNTKQQQQQQITRKPQNQPINRVGDDLVPEELEKKRKQQLNESTYYSTRGAKDAASSYFSSLRNNVQTILGVKDQEDDWIFNLNIGNVMHLLPMSLEELNLHIDNSHELSRDAMLEKIILLSVSYFCVGTELRFLSSTAQKEVGKAKTEAQYDLDRQYTKADSEMWHAMALEAAGTFLPSECPLVSHIIVSYQKHHSPALTTIPEDEPLIEQLKVVRPLNEIKQSGTGADTINYHQIIRTYQRVLPQPLRGQQLQMETGGRIKIQKFAAHEDMEIDAIESHQEFQPSSQIASPQNQNLQQIALKQYLSNNPKLPINGQTAKIQSHVTKSTSNSFTHKILKPAQTQSTQYQSSIQKMLGGNSSSVQTKVQLASLLHGQQHQTATHGSRNTFNLGSVGTHSSTSAVKKQQRPTTGTYQPSNYHSFKGSPMVAPVGQSKVTLTSTSGSSGGGNVPKLNLAGGPTLRPQSGKNQTSSRGISSSGPGSSTGSLSTRRPSRPHQINAPGLTSFTTRAPKTMTLINNRTKAVSSSGSIPKQGMAIFTGRLPSKESPMTSLRMNNNGRPPLNHALIPKKKVNNFVGVAQQPHSQVQQSTSTSTMQMMGISKPQHMSLTNWLLQGGATNNPSIQKTTITLGQTSINSAKVLKIMKAK